MTLNEQVIHGTCTCPGLPDQTSYYISAHCLLSSIYNDVLIGLMNLNLMQQVGREHLHHVVPDINSHVLCRADGKRETKKCVNSVRIICGQCGKTVETTHLTTLAKYGTSLSRFLWSSGVMMTSYRRKSINQSVIPSDDKTLQNNTCRYWKSCTNTAQKTLKEE